jgi:hypothetical protein
MSSSYAVLMETYPDDCESVYNFLKVQGNEKNLKHLEKQLNDIDDQVIIDDVNMFNIDIRHLVSEQTVDELCKLQLNNILHRKFNGTLKIIDFSFKKKDQDAHKMFRIHDIIGNGDISQYIDDEVIFDSEVYYSSSDDDEDELVSKIPDSLRVRAKK